MNQEGIESIAGMPRVAGQLEELDGRAETESALDDLEDLTDALDPRMHGTSCQLAEGFRAKLVRAKK